MLNCANRFEKFEVCIKVVRKLCTSHLRSSIQTYYDVLKLQPNCTSKDIRNAFLMLSKEFHPDKNQNDPRTHHQFVKLNEAYSILSRPQKRREYDLSLVPRHTPQPGYYYSPNNTNYTHANEQYFWRPEHNHTTQDVKSKKNLSKSWIVVLCILFTSAGVGLQVLAISKSVTFSREKLDRLSEANSRMLADVRQRASENGNEMQLDIIKQRIEDSVHQHNLSRQKGN